jgi:hypothetical protein
MIESTAKWFFVFCLIHGISHFSSRWLFWDKYRTLSKTEILEWNQRVVAFVFSVMVLSAIYTVSPLSYELEQLWLFGIAYTIYDFACCLYLHFWILPNNYLSRLDKKALTMEMKIHHSLMFILLTLQYVTSFRPEVACSFLKTEGSTPFLQIRYFLYKLGMENHPTYVINGVLLWISFGYFRLWSMPQPLWSLLKATEIGELHWTFGFGAIVMGIGLFLMNSYWFYLISEKLFRVIMSLFKASRNTISRNEPLPAKVSSGTEGIILAGKLKHHKK